MVAGFTEKLFIAWQALLHVTGKGAGTNIVKDIGVAVKAFDQLIKGAIILDAGKKIVDGCCQAGAGLCGRHCPGNGSGVCQIEGYLGGRIKGLIDHQFVGINDGMVNFVVIDQAQQVNHFHLLGFFKYELRVLLLQFVQQGDQAAAGQNLDAFAIQVGNILWSAVATSIDNLRGGVQVGLAVLHLVGSAGVFSQTGGCQIGTLVLVFRLVEARVELLQCVFDAYIQLYLQVFGKAAGQFILEAGIPVAVLIISGGGVAGDHDQAAALLDGIQMIAGRLFTGTQQERHKGPGRGQDQGVAPAYQSHWPSIGKISP